ncbi:hypothetical protein K2173_026340 [Erythroxylum novogranatense]|uniref:Phosphatidic acid phosphatase type 2/haloperoxidase domain-containing protein n=1 Tax=Erythroxylum novogranatense TaxID=1862640 RepID=A0AAV8SNU6_9ROSI|nr:hypothetical protein K2173_026340 [Erythroxylum novogranatense]
MAEIQLGTHNSLQSHGAKEVARDHLHDWVILVLLGAIVGILNAIEPFHRFIGQGMMTDYMFPFKQDSIPFWAVPFIAVLLPMVIFAFNYYRRKDIYDLHHAILGLLFSVLITGVITDTIKDAVGRPRPNFFWRCFPDGKPLFDAVSGDVICHGDPKIIKEGYKSFPSGHTSWSFAGLTYLAWYLAGKIRAFDRRGHVAKLCIVLLPVLVAALIGISRVDDYWHHWTDVFTGAFLGTVVAAFCYLQFYPFPHHEEGWAPHAFMNTLNERIAAQSLDSTRKPQPGDIEIPLY